MSRGHGRRWASWLPLIFIAVPSSGAAQAAAVEGTVIPPHWLEGCWEMRGDELVTEEHWMTLRGGTMLGMSRTVRGNDLVGYELLLLRETASGWEYVAHPSGQPAASFQSTTSTDTTIVFTNPAHDFPQTIAYTRLGSDSLLAWIAGEQGGQRRQIQFSYRRVPCPGGV